MEQRLVAWVEKQLSKFPALTPERWHAIALILAQRSKTAEGQCSKIDKAA